MIKAYLLVMGWCGALLSPVFACAHEGPHSGEHHAVAAQAISASAAFDPAGRLWLATARDGFVLISHSDDLGKTFSTTVKVNPQAEVIAAEGESRPKIAFGPHAEIYVSYTQVLDKPYTGHIRFSRSLDGGKTFSTPIIVNDNVEIITHRFDSLMVNSRGEIHLAWLDKRDQSAALRAKQAYVGAALYYAVSKDGGASFSPNKKISDHACECCRIALALDTDGTPVAAWRQVYGKNIRDHAVARLDGSASSRISYDEWEIDACPHHGPSLSIGADGSYHVAWFTNGKNRSGLYYARSIDQGVHFPTPLRFGNEDAQASHPAVLSVGKSVYLVWKEFNGQHTVIQQQFSANNGATWSAPRKLAESSDASDHPLLIARGENVFLAWNTLRDGFQLIGLSQEVSH